MPTNDNQQTTIQRTIEIDGQQIPVSEEVYRAYKRPLWAEHKRKEREKRCRDENGNRCTKSCKDCPKLHEGRILSLEKFADDGYDIPSPVDVAEIVAGQILLEQLSAALDELYPENRKIADLFSAGKSEREIAAEVGLSQKGVNKRKIKIFAWLRESLEKFE